MPSGAGADGATRLPEAEDAPCGLLCFTDDGRIAWANAWMHRCVGAEAGTLPGVLLETLFMPASRVFHSTHFFPLLKLHGRAEEIHLTIKGGDGSEVPVLVNAEREVVEGKGFNRCAVMRMSRRKEFEAALVAARRQAEAATAGRDEFLAMVSHELRTPLGAILGWVNILRRSRLDEALLQRAFDTIERNARAQSNLIEDLLDVSRIVSGKLRLSPRPIGLPPVVEAAAETARPSAVGKDIELTLALDQEAGLVYADPDRLQQVVWNLLSNAIKFTPHGGRVQVTLQRVGSRVRLQVSDNGSGIPRSQLPYLFERFWQADATTQRERTGLGLGLSICKSLVEMHGGTIAADSPGPGEGAVFTVELPLALTAPQPRTAVRGDTAQPATPLDGLRVLVVDDDEDARGMMQLLFTGYGAEVSVAASCEEALGLLAGAEVDVLVSDIGMPGQDGWDLIRQVRGGAVPRHAAVPAVAITGLARLQDRVSLLRAGFQAHLCKPVDPEEAVALVRALARRIAP